MEKKISVVRAIAECERMTEFDRLALVKSYLLGWTSEETALRIVKANSKLTADDIEEYKNAHGASSAAGLLLLAGPDGFSGSYDEYDALMGELEGGYVNDPA